MAGCGHAWNQPHPRRSRGPRLAPRRRVLRRRPRPHDRRHDVRARPPRSGSPAASRAPTTFADLVDATVHEITLNGDGARPRDGVRRQPDRAARPGGRQRAGRPGRLHLLPHRRGAAPLRRPRRRPGLPLLAVRGAGRPPGVHHVRAARPEGAVHVQRHRARATGRSSPTPRRPSPSETGDGAVACGASRRPSRCRRTSPRWSPASTTRSSTPTTASTATSRSATTAASRWSSTSTSTSWSRSPSRASSSSRTPSTSPTPSASTTSSTCRSTTWARWRTPAA